MGDVVDLALERSRRRGPVAGFAASLRASGVEPILPDPSRGYQGASVDFTIIDEIAPWPPPATCTTPGCDRMAFPEHCFEHMESTEAF